MHLNATPAVSFTPTADSFPFQTKLLLLSQSRRISLESQSTTPPSPDNGVFTPGSLPLCVPHAEVWMHGNQIIIRDRGSTFGTYVNGVRIQQQTLLQNGDVIRLGVQLSRSSTTPTNTTDAQLKPIEATVNIVGI